MKHQVVHDQSSLLMIFKCMRLSGCNAWKYHKKYGDCVPAEKTNKLLTCLFNDSLCYLLWSLQFKLFWILDPNRTQPAVSPDPASPHSEKWYQNTLCWLCYLSFSSHIHRHASHFPVWFPLSVSGESANAHQSPALNPFLIDLSWSCKRVEVTHTHHIPTPRSYRGHYQRHNANTKIYETTHIVLLYETYCRWFWHFTLLLCYFMSPLPLFFCLLTPVVGGSKGLLWWTGLGRQQPLTEMCSEMER